MTIKSIIFLAQSRFISGAIAWRGWKHIFAPQTIPAAKYARSHFSRLSVGSQHYRSPQKSGGNLPGSSEHHNRHDSARWMSLTICHPNVFQRAFTSKVDTFRQPNSGDRTYKQRLLRLGLRLKGLFFGALAVFVLALSYLYITDARSSIHRWITVPFLRFLYPDAEEAHEAGTRILKELYRFGIHPRERGHEDAAGDLKIKLFGHTLLNPLAISAGLDKHAAIPSPLFALGPSIVEVGGITPLPQEGNAKPRVWRIVSQNALINRYGLNSIGAEHVARKLRQRVREFALSSGFGVGEEAERMVLDGEAGAPPGSLVAGKLLAVQIAKNKSTPEQDYDAVKRDYVYCVEQLAKFADIIVVNVSSPNTPGLRSLQRVEPLTNILTGVVDATKSISRKTKPAVMVKVSPDEDLEDQIVGICQAVVQSGVDGVIVGNTTTKRPDPLPPGYILPERESRLLLEQGGYSGPQMFERTLALVKKYRYFLDKVSRESNVETAAAAQKVIFATGGITNGQQAREILGAGASITMLYTAIVFGGIGKISSIKQELRKIIKG